MKSFAQTLWIIAILLAIVGIFNGAVIYSEAEAITHQMTGLLTAAAWAVVPYCIARGVHAMIDLSDKKE